VSPVVLSRSTSSLWRSAMVMHGNSIWSWRGYISTGTFVFRNHFFASSICFSRYSGFVVGSVRSDANT
jgi:hypothetical protein